MIGKIAMATATLATAAMISAAPAAAGGLYYSAGNDRLSIEIGYRDRRYDDYDRYYGYGYDARGPFGGYRNHHRRADFSPLQRHRWILRNRGGVKAWKVKRRLKNRGFYRIRIVDNLLPIYKFRACRNGKRFKIATNRFGEIRWKDRIGRCGGPWRLHHRHRKANWYY